MPKNISLKALTLILSSGSKYEKSEATVDPKVTIANHTSRKNQQTTEPRTTWNRSSELLSRNRHTRQFLTVVRSLDVDSDHRKHRPLFH